MYSRIPLSVEVRRVLKLLMYTLLGLLLFTSAYFFVKTTNTAERGYQLREHQFRQKDLEAENRILKQRVLEAESINELKKSAAVSGMVEPEKPLYVKPQGPLSKRR